MKKRLCSLLLVLCLLAGLLPAHAASASFNDVSPKAWYYEHVQYVQDHNLMAGTGNGKFSPQSALTRAMFVTILGRLAGVDESGYYGSAFTDVPTGMWYSAYIQWAYQNNIVAGYGGGKFGLNDPVTREQMAAFITRYLSTAGITLPDAANTAGDFLDMDDAASYARPALELMRRTAILYGDTDGCFHPKRTASRAEAAALFMRLHEMLSGLPQLLPDQSDFVTQSGTVTLTGRLISDTNMVVQCLQEAYADNGVPGSRTSLICGSDNTWAITAKLKPDWNRFTFYVQDARGARVTRTVTVTYDCGTNYIPSAAEVAYDEALHTYYANDILLLYLDLAATEAQLQTAVNAISGKVVGKVAALNLYQVQVTARSRAELQSAADTLMEQYRFVQYATYDAAAPDASATLTAVAPNDPWQGDVSAEDWTDNTIGGSNWWIEAIDGQAAWSDNQTRGTISVGISDSSFDIGHEDLKNRCSFPNDVLKNRNQHNPVSNGTSTSPDYHGTHVAGIIGAEPNNGKGITGTVWNVNLLLAPTYAAENTDQYLSWDTSEYANLAYLVQGGAKIVNYSQGKTNFLTKEHDTFSEEFLRREGNLAAIAIARLLDAGYDFVVVQSAGNGLGDTIRAVDARQNGWFASITAQSVTASARTSIQDVRDRVIIVGAAEPVADSAGLYRSCDFSNYGAQVSVCAPGSDIYSTTPGNTITGFETSGGYRKERGTSMAAPIVSGVCAEVWAANLNLSGAEVKSIVCETASGHVIAHPDTPSSATYRLVNARLAVERAIAWGEGISSISGRTVLAGTNEPLSVAVTAVSGSTVWDTVSDEATGAFSLSLTAGTYTLRLSKPGYTINGETEYTVTVPLGENQMFIFPEPFAFTRIPDAAILSGTVVDDVTGGALAGAQVTVYDAGGAEAGSARTSTGGGFRIPLAVEGNYTLSVSMSGYDAKQLTNVTVSGSASVGTIRLTASSQSDFAGGDGTEENPYQIATAAQLAAICENMSAHYVLANDIALSGYWTAIGASDPTKKIETFSGSLDGAGHTIRNLKMIEDQKHEHYGNDMGLFGCVNGSIKNLNLEDLSITTDGIGVLRSIGSIAGTLEYPGSIENCNVSGTIHDKVYEHDDLSYVGGIVGTSAGTIRHCTFSGTLYGGVVGGIDAINGVVEFCTTSGNFHGTRYAGGIAAITDGETFLESTVRDCASSANVSILPTHETYASCGGIAATASRKIERCYSTGCVTIPAGTEARHAGGITGQTIGNRQRAPVVTISDCYFAGQVVVTSGNGTTGPVRIGGISGYMEADPASVIQRCYSTGTLRSAAVPVTLRGIVGESENSLTVQSCYYLNTASGAYGTPVTDAQLRQQSTFAGFDFGTVWTFVPGSYPYPQLRSNLQ